ncbi:MAG: hypothetical protein Q7R81_03545 [Candidatus Peregrinibacteria bacterium]|nr:hypothetical protein [Candidatus Peregrinibacteria bacterium]
MVTLPLPARLALRTVFTILLIWGMATGMSEYFFVTGGIDAYIIIGALLTLMNLIVRPLLTVVTFPLRLLMTIAAIVLANSIFLYLTYWIILQMDPDYVTLVILGGLKGWAVVSLTLGFMNWLMKLLIK